MKVLLFVLIFISYTATAQLTGKVVGVADGDTFTMLVDGNEQVKVRLHGIDCPEKKQAYGNVAKQFTAEHAFGKRVTVKENGKDRYGRVIGIVYLSDGRILNELLLMNGLAWQYWKYDKNPVWLQMAYTAKAKKLGLWKDGNAIPPWEFRKQKKG